MELQYQHKATELIRPCAGRHWSDAEWRPKQPLPYGPSWVAITERYWRL